MALRPYEEIIGPLVIPVRGKEYTLPVVSAVDGLRLKQVMTGEKTDLPTSWLYKTLLGDAFDQMLADHVGGDVIDRVFITALTDVKDGRDSAEDVWEHGVPKALREAAKGILLTQPTTPLAAASTTPAPVSGSGTKTRTRAAQSRGKKSSATGR